MIPAEAKRAMQGVIPSLIGTCSADGVPNAVHLSQVFYVDPTHVALSFQFFGKTASNIRENPYVEIRCFDPSTSDRWILKGKFLRCETEGAVFDEMDALLEAIASMTGMTGVFKLRGADIYEVLSIERHALVPIISR